MGLIGGPDGPTAVFIATGSPLAFLALLLAAAALIGAGVWLVWRRRRK